MKTSVEVGTTEVATGAIQVSKVTACPAPVTACCTVCPETSETEAMAAGFVPPGGPKDTPTLKTLAPVKMRPLQCRCRGTEAATTLVVEVVPVVEMKEVVATKAAGIV